MFTHLDAVLLCRTITYVQRATYKVILNVDDEVSVQWSDNLWTREKRFNSSRWKTNIVQSRMRVRGGWNNQPKGFNSGTEKLCPLLQAFFHPLFIRCCGYFSLLQRTSFSFYTATNSPEKGLMQTQERNDKKLCFHLTPNSKKSFINRWLFRSPDHHLSLKSFLRLMLWNEQMVKIVLHLLNVSFYVYDKRFNAFVRIGFQKLLD